MRNWGRKNKYTDDEKGIAAMQADIDGYFEACATAGDAPNLPGLRCSVNMTDQDWNVYARSASFGAIMTIAKQQIEATIIRGGMRNKFNAIFCIFLLKSLHGYIDRQSVEIDDKSKGKSDEAIDERIDDLLSKLNKKGTKEQQKLKEINESKGLLKIA